MNDLNNLVFDFSADQTAASIPGIIQNAGQIKLWLFLNHLDVLADPFGSAYTAEHAVILEFLHTHCPSGESNLRVVNLAQLPANRLRFGVGFALDNTLSARFPSNGRQRTQPDRIRSEAASGIQTGVEFGNGSSVGIKIEKAN